MKKRLFVVWTRPRSGWRSLRQLDRQIGTQFYERTMLSKDKASLLKEGAIKKPEDEVSFEEMIKDPLFFEFVGLKDRYSEGELEHALVSNLRAFLLELGKEFTFIDQQRRLRIDDEWHKIDLLLFHRRLRCLVIIDLKLNKLTHADIGQMHLYTSYAKENWMIEGENPPVGLILCAEKKAELAHYALDTLPNKVLAAEYRTILPSEEDLTKELQKLRRQLELRTITDDKSKDSES